MVLFEFFGAFGTLFWYMFSKAFQNRKKNYEKSSNNCYHFRTLNFEFSKSTELLRAFSFGLESDINFSKKVLKYLPPI